MIAELHYVSTLLGEGTRMFLKKSGNTNYIKKGYNKSILNIIIFYKFNRMKFLIEEL